MRSADESHQRERLREAGTMALYVALSLLAVMIALPKEISPASASSPAAAIVLTGLGLLAAHWLAFRISARLAHGGELTPAHLDLLAAQILGGLAVTAAAALPVIVLGQDPGILVAELVLVAFVGVFGYQAARASERSHGRALLYVGEVMLIAVGALAIKNVVHY